MNEPSFKKIRSAVIWFSVKVPVLSVQMTLVEPSVSTAGRLLTRALCSAMIFMPRDNEIVETAGIASGMAATARIKAVCSSPSRGCRVISPAASTAIPAAKATRISSLLNRPISWSSGVFSFFRLPASR